VYLFIERATDAEVDFQITLGSAAGAGKRLGRSANQWNICQGLGQ